MRRRGMATMTRAHDGLAAEMKALANNLQRRRGGVQGPVLASHARQATQHDIGHLQGSLCCRCWPWADGEGVAPSRDQCPLSGAAGREEGESAQGWSVVGCSMHSGGSCRRMGGAGAPGCAGGHAPHPSVPLPGHQQGVGGCRTVPASPSPPTSAGEDAGPTSSATASVRASPGCAAGREGTGATVQRHPLAPAGRPAAGRWGQGCGAHMMVQDDSGFRMWQVQAAPQYWRKVW